MDMGVRGELECNKWFGEQKMGLDDEESIESIWNAEEWVAV